MEIVTPAGRARRRFQKAFSKIPRPKLPDPPSPKNVFASLIGGGGGSVLSGYLAHRDWDPELVAIAMTAGGAVGALTLPGPWGVAANGIASAGFGQLMLEVMRKRAVNDVKERVDKALNDAATTKPSNARYLPSLTDSFAARNRADDEERMTDPDLEYSA